MRDGECRARKSVQEIAGERLARRERDGMQQPVEAAPFGAQRGEERGHVVVLRHVARQHRHRPEFRGDPDDALLEVVVDIGEGERRALALAGLRDAVGDRAIGQNARDQNLLAGEKAHRDSARWPVDGLRGRMSLRRSSGSAPITPHATRSFGTPGDGIERPGLARMKHDRLAFDARRSVQGESRNPLRQRRRALFPRCGWERLTGAVAPGNTKGGPAENPFGDVQTGVV